MNHARAAQIWGYATLTNPRNLLPVIVISFLIISRLSHDLRNPIVTVHRIHWSSIHPGLPKVVKENDSFLRAWTSGWSLLKIAYVDKSLLLLTSQAVCECCARAGHDLWLFYARDESGQCLVGRRTRKLDWPGRVLYASLAFSSF
jgi:hypothetical protein